MAGQLPQIDLRDRTVGREPELVRPHVAVLEEQLRDALSDLTPSPGVLESLIGLCEARIVPDVGASPRAEAWTTLLSLFLELGKPSPYVGAFKVQLDSIVAAGAALAPLDRSLLARLVLDRTSATAATRRDFRAGVGAACSLDPFVLAPSTVIDALLRPCIRWTTGAGTSALIADALMVTLDALARGSGQSVSDMDVWALRAAVSMIDEREHGDVRQHAQRVTGPDRALIERILAPEASRRRWSLLAHR